MNLLFDENLSFKLRRRLNDLFPDSSQVRLIRLERTDDRLIWDFAKASGFVLVTFDADFVEMTGLIGPPPKVICLRCGNQPTAEIEALLRRHADVILDFERDSSACLEIY